MITWIILGGSLLLAGYGIYLLLQGGKPRSGSNIETNTNMKTSGIYKYIRHPLYTSLILLGAVTLIKNPSLLATSLFSVATVFLYATARTEEKENILKFGRDYAIYMKRTSMFFPFLS
jgi:protein-S-isoprenylcysteine O-methyltransferase Ste14